MTGADKEEKTQNKREACGDKDRKEDCKQQTGANMLDKLKHHSCKLLEGTL